jgi:glycogen debranching enzyme
MSTARIGIGHMTAPRQPLLHEETVVLRAPSQAWSSRDGSMGSRPIHGIYHSDMRVVAAQQILINGEPTEHLATVPHSASAVTFISITRQLDTSVDPSVKVEHRRDVSTEGSTETVTVTSRLATEITLTVTVSLRPDLTPLDRIKSGHADQSAIERAEISTGQGAEARWGNGTVSAAVTASDASIETVDDTLTLTWTIRVPTHGSTSVQWSIEANDSAAVVQGVSGPAPWRVPELPSGDDRLTRWIAQSLDDLDALRLTTTAAPGEEFLAAGAPWFFTLFGRDAIWAARFLLPLGTPLAASTLRVLARLQGTEHVAATAEQPGKIMHELRRATLNIPAEGIALPPLYYGTVDATPLWVCLVHDAWRWGMPEAEVRELLPNLEAALAWMRDFGDADGDGLLEYIDETGHGLANQGWKDSGDSVQWRDGTLAEGPIALCEVQAYAYEAAMHGADVLEHFGVGEPEVWREWAASLKRSFAAFWISDAKGRYPAIALDAAKRPVDTVTSNLGHLLGTGILSEGEAATIAARLVGPQLSSGFGLRTLSTDSAGYWPLSYHGGSVWAHDTAIAIAGLAREGLAAEAAVLSEGLLSAAASFDYRLPELHAGAPRSQFPSAVPYPAACRPQAWSAAAAISVLASSLNLRPGEL